MMYLPRHGDIITMDFNPTKGNEQKGQRPAVVVSNDIFHKFSRGSAIVCPITNKDRGISIHINLDNRTKTTGVIMTDQVKTLDLTQRNASFIEKIPVDILSELCDIIGGFTEIEDDTHEDDRIIEIAKRLLDILNVEIIAEKTQLPVEKVQELKDAHLKQTKERDV